MKTALFCLLAASATQAQLKFGGGGDVNTRLGLLGPDKLNVDPLGRGGDQQSSAPFTQQGTGRIPQTGSEFGGQQQCCCVPNQEQCGDAFGREDLVGSGLIDPRIRNQPKQSKPSLSTRIVNRPGAAANTNSKQETCSSGQKICCYDAGIDLGVFGRSCISPSANTRRTPTSGCGGRTYSRPASGLAHGTSSPGEFPWTCLILTENNDFVGSCAIIPQSSSNSNSLTRKVLTAAHKLKGYDSSDLKIRLGEWDASGFNQPETKEHLEYGVTRTVIPTAYNSGRLNSDIALLLLDRNIDLSHPYINTACLPSSRDQFDHQFSNGTGVRCWVAGWGKDEIDGEFQFLQRSVDLPLVPHGECEAKLKVALNRQRQGSGNRFILDQSEICAGGEIGKDACTGDGGSPLVCQASTGRWTVVGLVTWGVGCASEIPGVYARVSEFRNFINSYN